MWLQASCSFSCARVVKVWLAPPPCVRPRGDSASVKFPVWISVIALIARGSEFCDKNRSAKRHPRVKPKLQLSQADPQEDPAFFLSAPEISVFVACCVMVNELRGLDRSLANRDIDATAFQQRFDTLSQRLAQAVESTQRFDVVLPVLGPRHFSPFFWRWFNWWDDYLKALTPSRVAEMERRARERGSLIDNLRPRGHWISYRSSPPLGF